MLEWVGDWWISFVLQLERNKSQLGVVQMLQIQNLSGIGGLKAMGTLECAKSKKDNDEGSQVFLIVSWEMRSPNGAIKGWIVHHWDKEVVYSLVT